MIRRVLSAPALHFAAAGAVLYLLTGWQGTAAPTVAAGAQLGRPLSDEEVLLQHALDLGLVEQEPVQRRLAQLAGFVGEEPAQVLELGLHRDDLVVRRILVDSARRLIRAAVLSREPSEEALAGYLAEHPERFERPEEIRLAARGEGRSEVKELPLQLRRDLERRFGRDFAQALEAERVGVWQGPLPSRQGPMRVLVREHLPARTAELAEVRDEVRSELLETLANRWLETRIAQLREEMGVATAEVQLAATSVGGAS